MVLGRIEVGSPCSGLGLWDTLRRENRRILAAGMTAGDIAVASTAAGNTAAESTVVGSIEAVGPHTEVANLRLAETDMTIRAFLRLDSLHATHHMGREVQVAFHKGHEVQAASHILAAQNCIREADLDCPGCSNRNSTL